MPDVQTPQTPPTRSIKTPEPTPEPSMPRRSSRMTTDYNYRKLGNPDARLPAAPRDPKPLVKPEDTVDDEETGGAAMAAAMSDMEGLEPRTLSEAKRRPEGTRHLGNRGATTERKPHYLQMGLPSQKGCRR
ncbi:hypothetical protein ARMSODRAFT_959592 [Armillaria solidipes]|uniref:Uncharacterized protein n=1 Tax=Armillaria solidipes TaxID=1076256 RepID=A0A2H3BDE0_9AGAR|nr:hypothetical protein ARMSODRAFT_959592 [Armillaria solidipes]